MQGIREETQAQPVREGETAEPENSERMREDYNGKCDVRLLR